MTTSATHRFGHGLLLAAVLALAACDRAPAPAPAAPQAPPVPTAEPAAPPASAASSVAAPRASDAWLGRWTGPEGTFVDLAAEGAGYRVTVQSLDGPATYAGRAVADGIAFDRNGNTETLRATDGQTTGMKWLLDKKNCLTIRTGEGFCRD